MNPVYPVYIYYPTSEMSCIYKDVLYKTVVFVSPWMRLQSFPVHHAHTFTHLFVPRDSFVSPVLFSSMFMDVGGN